MKFSEMCIRDSDYIYRALNDWEKAAFNRLYDQYYYHRHNDLDRKSVV